MNERLYRTSAYIYVQSEIEFDEHQYPSESQLVSSISHVNYKIAKKISIVHKREKREEELNS